MAGVGGNFNEDGMPQVMAPPPAPMGAGVNKDTMKRYYDKVFPVEELFEWLSHGDSEYASRREWCFTLIGDIFTRYRTHLDTNELKKQLVLCAPEKIDIGAIYNIPTKMRHAAAIIPQERELVFDIDMSDYDDVRSCCKGKKICRFCWPWMSNASKTLADMLQIDFGFRHLMPVFSGRRGLHLWVSDHRARKLTDDERNAIAHYMSIFAKDGNINIVKSILHDNLHPSLDRVYEEVLRPGFEAVFVDNPENPNCLSTANPGHSKPKQIVWDNLRIVLKQGNMFAHLTSPRPLDQGTDWSLWFDIMQKNADDKKLGLGLSKLVKKALIFQLMYPRLDIDVTTKRNHLLKSPFCIHPGTEKLCVPLTLDTVDSFDPDLAPRLPELLKTGKIEDQWMRPFRQLLADLKDEDKAEGIHRFKPYKRVYSKTTTTTAAAGGSGATSIIKSQMKDEIKKEVFS